MPALTGRGCQPDSPPRSYTGSTGGPIIGRFESAWLRWLTMLIIFDEAVRNLVPKSCILKPSYGARSWKFSSPLTNEFVIYLVC